MRYISAKEYQSLTKKQGHSLSLGRIYELMRDGKIPFVEQDITKTCKRIPWDDTTASVCQLEVVAQ